MSDDLAEVILKAGYSVSYKLNPTKGAEIKFKNGWHKCNYDMHTITIKTSKYTNTYKREIVHYHDYVYCVTVPNETLLVRSNGKVLFSGNCRCMWLSFDPNLMYADNQGHFIPKKRNPEKWEEWINKNIKERYGE